MLKLVVDKLEDVPEPFRVEYTEKDGKFHLNADGIPDVAPLQEAIRKERAAATKASNQMKDWEKLGKTPSEIQELLALQAQTEEEKATKAGEWDKLRAQMNEKHAAELKAKDALISDLRSRHEHELVDARATAAIAAANGNPKLLLPIVKQCTKVDESLNVIIVDAKGDPRVDGKGEPLTFSDLLLELKASDDYAAAFKGSGQSGSGTRPTSNMNGGGIGPRAITKKSDFKNEAERAAWIDANSLEQYNALPFR